MRLLATSQFHFQVFRVEEVSHVLDFVSNNQVRGEGGDLRGCKNTIVEFNERLVFAACVSWFRSEVLVKFLMVFGFVSFKSC
jgi:hypothetical protein